LEVFVAEVNGSRYPRVEVMQGGVTRFMSWCEAVRSIAQDAVLGALVEESDGVQRPLTSLEQGHLLAEAEDWTGF
jgi:hypothetical protein